MILMKIFPEFILNVLLFIFQYYKINLKAYYFEKTNSYFVYISFVFQFYTRKNIHQCLYLYRQQC